MTTVIKSEIIVKEIDLEVVLVLPFVIHVVMILMVEEWEEFPIETMGAPISMITDVIEGEVWVTEEVIIKDLADIRVKEIIEDLEI